MAEEKDLERTPEDDLSIEEAFVKLDALLEKLSDKDVSLEESFSVYEEGTKLLKYCNEKLDKVEKKMLVMNEEGGLDEF